MVEILVGLNFLKCPYPYLNSPFLLFYIWKVEKHSMLCASMCLCIVYMCVRACICARVSV